MYFTFLHYRVFLVNVLKRDEERTIIVILFYFLFVRTNTTYNSETKCIKETIKLDLFQYNQKILIKN